MAFPVEISFRNFAPALVLDRLVREQAQRLSTVREDISACRVVVERARHGPQHADLPVHVGVDLTLREPEDSVGADAIDGNAFLATYEAFRLALERLRAPARQSSR